MLEIRVSPAYYTAAETEMCKLYVTARKTRKTNVSTVQTTEKKQTSKLKWSNSGLFSK